MNTKQQGGVGVAVAIAHYAKQGHEVLVPINDTARYDLVVDKGGTLVRVQVKTSRREQNKSSYEVQLATSGGNRSWSGVPKKMSSDDVDELFVYIIPLDRIYIFPPALFDGKAKITVGEDKRKYMHG